MSRPFTCLCLIMAATSGLYLYNSKHDAQVLDQEITRLTQAAAKSRSNIDRLRSEYDHLSDPERLKALAGQWLTLQPTDPKQFATMADVDKRLPAIGAPATPQNELLAIAEPAAINVAQPVVAPEKPPAAPVQLAVAARPTPSTPPTPAARPATSLLPLIAQSQAAPVMPAAQAASVVQAAQAARPTPPHPVAEPKQPTQLAALPSLPRAPIVPHAQPTPPPPTPPGLRTTPAVAATGYNPNEMVTRVAQKINPYNPQPPMVGSSLGMARVAAQQPIQARP